MTFSQEWNEIYRTGQQNVQWPWSDLISLVMRYGCTKGLAFELGCGTRANKKFFDSIDMRYQGVDGIYGDDFTICIHVPTENSEMAKLFMPDLIFDRAAVTHNDTESIRNTLKLAYDALKPGGYYIGIDWFSTKHDDFKKAEKMVDGYTNTDYTRGQFKGVGKVHFSNRAHIEDLFKDFNILQLSEKVITTEDQPTFASWNIVCRKPQ